MIKRKCISYIFSLDLSSCPSNKGICSVPVLMCLNAEK